MSQNHEHWESFENGTSVGQAGSENGIIVADQECPDCARITLERNGHAQFAITCGIDGWMVHTRFFDNQDTAERAFNEMKQELSQIIDLILSIENVEQGEPAATRAIRKFVERFP